jgi:hypothetical protein
MNLNDDIVICKYKNKHIFDDLELFYHMDHMDESETPD